MLINSVSDSSNPFNFSAKLHNIYIKESMLSPKTDLSRFKYHAFVTFCNATIYYLPLPKGDSLCKIKRYFEDNALEKFAIPQHLQKIKDINTFHITNSPVELIP